MNGNLALVWIACFTAVLLVPPGQRAEAQLWNPLDTKAKPNMLVALDTSVTMGIDATGCNQCHENGLRPSMTRMEAVKTQIRNALPVFEGLFVYGGYTYRGCGEAHVDRRSYPNPADLADSFTRLDNLIASAGICTSPGRGGERSLPNGNVTTCITPGCTGDGAVLSALVASPARLPGLTLPPEPVASLVTCNTTNQTPPTLDVDQAFADAFASRANAWKPLYVSIDPNDVKDALCDPLIGAVQDVWEQVQRCLLDPAAFWPGVAAWLGNSASCSPGTIAANICDPAGSSPFLGTCVCDATLQGCTDGVANSDCDTPMVFKARQQVAVCESYNPNTFGAYYAAQADNRVNPGGCRENVAIFLTDGAFGGSAGIAAEVAKADRNGVYTPAVDVAQRNRFVFHVSTEFGAEADAMQAQVTNGRIATRFSALDQDQMLESFAVIVNRIFRGVYTGANMTLDRYGQRVALHLFTVPSGPGDAGERYLNRPSRIAWHEVDPNTGTINRTPIFETDWASKAGPPLVGIFGGLDDVYLGPRGQFSNGVDRIQNIAADSIDRTGDGVADAHPDLTWGYMLGGINTQPVIVDAPREIPTGPGAAAFAAFMGQARVRDRPRVIYVLSNGYLHAIKGGERRDFAPSARGPTVGKIELAYDYVEDAQAGRELWRYKPGFAGWLDTTRVRGQATYTWNRAVQQPILNGQIVVREMQVGNAGNASDYQTLLAFSQGKNGRGYAVLDVTDPMAGPAVRRTWTLPITDRASQEPMLYVLPTGTLGAVKASVIVTGGLDGSRTIYRYDATGPGWTAAALPGADPESYPTEPVCLDASGKGHITHCYVLSSVGRLVRVGIDAIGAFTAIRDITPAVPFSPIGGGRKYFTRPTVFFGSDGAINLAFGSGDITNLVANTGARDVFFKIKDELLNKATPPLRATAAGVCAPDAAGNTDGVFVLEPGERVVSAPIVGKGVVAFTTFVPGGSACVAGSGRLYAFNFDRCLDAFDSSERPKPRPIGDGIPTSPALLRAAERLVTLSSGAPTQPARTSPVRTRGGALMPLKKLFWRAQVHAH